jgi:hypothetical protein
MNFRCLVIVLALCVGASNSWAQSTRQVEQKIEDTSVSQPKTESTPATVPAPSADQSNEKAAHPESSKGAAEGSEYWDYRGYRVKITDGMLVLFTLALVLIGLFQAIFLKRTLDATAIAAYAARDQTLNFAKLERPYLYVFNPSGLEIDFDQEDQFHYLKYSVANYGKTPARIESASIGINVGVEPNQPDAVRGWHDFLVSPLFITGERRDNPTASIPDGIEIEEYGDENIGPFPIPSLEGEDEFFFWIKIKYDGPFSKDHETSACWRWDSNSHRLVLYEKHNSQT